MTISTLSAQQESAWTDEGEAFVFLVPSQLLERYLDVALRRADPKKLESGDWYSDLREFPGVWATGATPFDCLKSLSEVLKEWLFIKLGQGDRDIPVLDEIDLTVLVGGR